MCRLLVELFICLILDSMVPCDRSTRLCIILRNSINTIMKKENWYIHTRVNTQPFIDILNQCKDTIDVTGNTSAIGSNSKQIRYNTHFQFYENELKKTLNLIIQERPEYKEKIQLNHLSISSLWSVEGHENSYHRLHKHSDSIDEQIQFDNCISTILYVNIPKKDPKGEFYFLLEKDNDTILKCINPEVGDLLIFPWTTYHGVYPQGPGLRKTINCDLIYNPSL